MFSFSYDLNRENSSINWHKIDYNRLSEVANEVFENISKEFNLDLSKVAALFEKYTELNDKNMVFYVYHLKDFIAIVNEMGLQLYDTGYGDDLHSPRFPLLVFVKGKSNTIENTRIERALSEINTFLPRNQHKDYVK